VFDGARAKADLLAFTVVEAHVKVCQPVREVGEDALELRDVLNYARDVVRLQAKVGVGLLGQHEIHDGLHHDDEYQG
jgi:hypothetical protein